MKNKRIKVNNGRAYVNAHAAELSSCRAAEQAQHKSKREINVGGSAAESQRSDIRECQRPTETRNTGTDNSSTDTLPPSHPLFASLLSLPSVLVSHSPRSSLSPLSQPNSSEVNRLTGSPLLSSLLRTPANNLHASRPSPLHTPVSPPSSLDDILSPTHLYIPSTQFLLSSSPLCLLSKHLLNTNRG